MLGWLLRLSSNIAAPARLTDAQCPFFQDGVWDGNLSTYFDMNVFLDIILKTVLENSGKRRIVFSSFDADICTMWVIFRAFFNFLNWFCILSLWLGFGRQFWEIIQMASSQSVAHVFFSSCVKCLPPLLCVCPVLRPMTLIWHLSSMSNVSPPRVSHCQFLTIKTFNLYVWLGCIWVMDWSLFCFWEFLNLWIRNSLCGLGGLERSGILQPQPSGAVNPSSFFLWFLFSGF